MSKANCIHLSLCTTECTLGMRMPVGPHPPTQTHGQREIQTILSSIAVYSALTSLLSSDILCGFFLHQKPHKDQTFHSAVRFSSLPESRIIPTSFSRWGSVTQKALKFESACYFEIRFGLKVFGKNLYCFPLFLKRRFKG